MAMIKCKECGNDVSSSAKTCPHCGIENQPTVATTSASSGCLSVIIFLVVIGFVVSQCTPEKSPEQISKEEADCKKDLQCLGDKAAISAGIFCREHIEKLAKYSFRWTDGTLEPKFSHFRWLDKNAATLTLSGDKIEFQNGFGAYQSHIYECDFDPETKAVLAVRADPGRL